MGTCRAKPTAAPRLDAQALFIDGFKQARAGVAVHLDCQSDDLFGQRLCQKRMRDSVFPVVLRPSSVRIKMNRCGAGRGWEATGRGALLGRPMPCDCADSCIFDSHGGSAEDHGEDGGRCSRGLRLVPCTEVANN